MFFGQFEREMFSSEMYSTWRNTHLPENIQLLINQEQGHHDIWETRSESEQITINREHKTGERESEPH